MAIVRRNTLVNDGAKASTSVNKSTGANYVSSYKPTTASSQGNTPTTYSNGSSRAPVSTAVNKVTGSNYVSSKKNTTPVTTYSNGTTYAPKSTPVSYNEGKNYISSMATPQQVKKVYEQYGVIPSTPKNEDIPRGRNTGSAGTSTGGGDYSGSSSSSSSSMSQAEQQKEDIVQKLKDLLAEQEKKAKEAYEAQLQEAYAKNKELWRSNADQINLNRARAERFSRNLYGEESGANNTNMARIGAGWASSHNQNNRNLASNDATALQNFNTNLSNAYNTLASGYSNFVLPVYTNRQNYLDELQYRRDANAMDYDYRRFLANAGLL